MPQIQNKHKRDIIENIRMCACVHIILCKPTSVAHCSYTRDSAEHPCHALLKPERDPKLRTQLWQGYQTSCPGRKREGVKTFFGKNVFAKKNLSEGFFEEKPVWGEGSKSIYPQRGVSLVSRKEGHEKVL